MKLKNVLLTLGLALGVGAAGIGAVSFAHRIDTKETKAATGDSYYFRGVISALDVDTWGTGSDTYRIIDGGDPLIVDLTAGDEFKISPLMSGWNDSTTILAFGGDAYDHWYEYSSNNWKRDIESYYGNDKNIHVNQSGKYALSVINGSLYIDYGMFYYSGSDNNWGITPDDDHPAVTVNGDAQTWSLTKDELFKMRYRNDQDGWTYGCFGYGNLKDRDFYGSFTYDNDNNIKTIIASDYDVTIGMTNRTWTVRVYPHGVRPDETAFVYVLDKYGSLLHENHYAYISSTDGYTMGTPGAIMESYPDTNHMYQQEFWTGMQNVEFNNNSDWSWKWDISVDGEWTNRGKCLILDGSTDDDGKWSSNVWVEPETAKFIENCMHFANYNEQQQGDGSCVSAGWYDTAVRAYEALDEKYQKEICSLPDVLERLQKWAIANKEHFVVTDGIGAFGSSVTPALGFLNNGDNNATAMIVVTVTFVSMVGVAGFFFLRRRKEQ